MKLLSKYRVSEFNKNVAILMSGTMLAQLIPLLLTPILTRLFTPEEFGGYSIYIAVVALASIFATGRYDMAILIPKLNKQAVLIAEISMLLNVLISLVFLIVILLFGDVISGWLNIEGIGIWLYLIPFSIFLAASIQIMTNLKIRHGSYKSLSLARVSQTASNNFLLLVIGFNFKFNGVLILGNLISQIICLSILFKNYVTSGRFKRLRVLATLKKYSNFPKHLMIAHIINAISARAPLFFITMLFGLTAAGFYSIVQRAFGLPSSVLATSFGEVFKQKASEEYKINGECHDLFISTLIKLSSISFIPFLVFFFIAPDVFSFAFGENWEVAGSYAQILTPMFFFRFISMPLSSIIIFANKTKIDIYWQIIFLICGVCSYFFSSSVEALLTYISFSFSCCYLASLYINHRLASGNGTIKALTNDNKGNRSSDAGM